MKLALNGATTMHADLETDINAAGAAGYDLVELWASKLRKYLQTHTIGELKTLIDLKQRRSIFDKFDRAHHVSLSSRTMN